VLSALAGPEHNVLYERNAMSGRKVIPLAERFKLKVGPMLPNGCTEFTGFSTKMIGKVNYGKLGYIYSGPPKRKPITAHRAAYIIAHGEIPDGLFVLHKCDNPLCVNPEHLFLGTHQDNMRDMMEKGRNRPGEKCPHAKLNEAQVLEIRRRWGNGEKIVRLSEEFGVANETVWYIVHRKNWRHI